MKRRSVYMIGNWKMHPSGREEALSLARGLKKKLPVRSRVKTVVCPPFIFLSDVMRAVGGAYGVGVQTIHHEEEGSFTGKVSVDMVADAGASYVIAGHSELRALGETNDEVNKKVRLALSRKLTAVLCVGERERDRQGEYLAFISDEIKKALQNVSEAELKNIIIAYEPIWAIGKTDKDAMKPHDVHETVLFIRKILTEQYLKEAALSVPVLYGGSVEKENVGALYREGDVDGFLVGHASLDADEFTDMVHIVGGTGVGKQKA